MAKTNAKEYLMDMAAGSREEWLKSLIYATIETDGNVTDEKLQEIADAYVRGSAQSYRIPTSFSNELIGTVKLTALKHTSGVNALMDNQNIDFSPNITIIHGMNGTGKSSYFRILNKMTGGDVEESILPNVYKDISEPILVKINYIKDDTPKEKECSGSIETIPDLTFCKVFDSNYLNSLISKRNVDATVIEPLGLSLFQKIVDYEIQIQDILSYKINTITTELPRIATDKLLEQNKGVFNNKHFDVSQRKAIEASYSFGDDKQAQLKNCKTQLESLLKFNIDTTLRLLNFEKDALSNIKRELITKFKSAKDLITEWNVCLLDYVKAKNNHSEAIKQFAILTTLSNTSSPEWRNFINAADQYKKITGNDDECPYCHRPYDDGALKIVQSYTSFLSDKSETELKNKEKALSIYNNKLLRYVPDINLDDNIKKILRAIAVNESQSLLEIVLHSIDANKNLYKELTGCVNEKKEMNSPVLSIEIINKKLDEEINTVDTKIAESQEKDSKLQPKIANLKERITILEDAKSIAAQKDAIRDWFNKIDSISTITDKKEHFKSRPISLLSTTAHNELITEKLANTFQNKLQEIGLKRLGMKVQKASNHHGIYSTELVLSNNENNIQQILSEGEQKGVGLAMFFAEIELQSGLNPIILDDPVNSLDNEIAKSFAQMLYKLNNQVILFNHELLFQSAFESMDHICPNYDAQGCRKQGKHIYIYETEEFNGNKGLIVSYKKQNAKFYLDKAEHFSTTPPFSDNVGEITNDLRQAVEHLIDEVVFRNQIPTRYSCKKSRIQWGKLKTLVNDSETIDKLNTIHSRLSGSSLHNGIESTYNQLRQCEANEFIRDLRVILNK
ncbi:AAA family ATPase [Xylanibacter oryzae]|uniref:AAA family ATPase n=1 Tax=Xylanibacter oryzae TaxID=185293 RepID=UPI00146FAC1A|nr:AAA family ATPase [Xylanibacter oryzae]